MILQRKAKLTASIIFLLFFGSSKAQDCPGLISHNNSINTSRPSLPGYLQPYKEQGYGVTITRISQSSGTPFGEGITGDWTSRAHTIYMSTQVWNADQSLLFLEWPGIFLDGETYKPVFKRDIPFPHCWSYREPDIMLHVKENSVYKINVRTGEQKAVMTVPGYSNFYWESQYDNGNIGGNRTAVIATRESDGKLVAFGVDFEEQKKFPDIDVSKFSSPGERGARISESGKYIRVCGHYSGTPWDYPMYIYETETGKYVSEQSRLYHCPGHDDAAVDTDGVDVYAGICKASDGPSGSVIFRFDNGSLRSAGRGADHTSGRNYKRPGWIFPSSATSEIFALRLDGKRIERICNSFASGCDYWGTTQAVPAPDGRRVMFHSCWGGGAQHAFVADFRDKCPAVDETEYIQDVALRLKVPHKPFLCMDSRARVIRIHCKLLLRVAIYAPDGTRQYTVDATRGRGCVSLSGTVLSRGIYVVVAKTSNGEIIRDRLSVR